MEPFVWNYILEKDLDEEDDSSINEDDSVHSNLTTALDSSISGGYYSGEGLLP